MPKKIDKLFKSIIAKESIWLGVLTKILGCTEDAADTYQNINCKIIEAINSGKININDITNENGEVHYGYYHRLIYNESIDFIRRRRVERNVILELELHLDVINENSLVDFDLAERIILENKDSIIVTNKIKGITLFEIAKKNKVSFSKIWRTKQNEINELKEKYKQ